MKSKLCRSCQQVKPIIEFQKSYGLTKDNLRGRCRQCENLGILIPKSAFKGRPKPKSDEPDNYSLTGVKFEDYMLMYELLRDIGYDTNGDIHRQFCDKYNLKYKPKIQRTQPYFLANGEKNPKHRLL